MKRSLFIVVSMLILHFSCENTAKKEALNKKEINSQKLNTIDSLGLKLFNEKCMICHTHIGKDASTMLAPPFFQVKKRYLQASLNKNDFVETMAYWVKNPKEENILMQATIGHFDIMPDLKYKEQDIVKIVNFIYKHDMEKPKWFDAHQKSHKKENRDRR